MSAWRVLAHMGYLQDILGFPSLSAGIWTLCIEMQFYAVSVVGWGLAQRLVRHRKNGVSRPRGAVLLALFGPPACISLFVWHGQTSTEPWVTHFFAMFFLGMIVWWTLDQTLPPCAFFVCVGVVAAQLVVEWKLDNAVALAVACAVFAAGRLGRLHDWLHWNWLQYLGRISYSLYLIHYPVSHMVTWLGWSVSGSPPAPPVAAMIMLASLAASIATAQLVYWAVEVPSLRWAARLKRPAVVGTAPPPIT
jgi:peptidoglycan/LPS O-acetylase OafA/YrhL